MSEHVVIIFAYHFPPDEAIGGARPFRFSKYLSKLGYKCLVFTAAAQPDPEDTGAVTVPDPFFACPRRGFGWQLERVVRKFLMPGDLGLEWSYHASSTARAYIRGHSGARITIFSTFPPLGSHLAAWQFARDKKYRWIADFRDPMYNERFDGPTHCLQRGMDRWLEHVLVRRADAVIANTDRAMNRLQSEFPSIAPRIRLIWNGFDPESRIQPLPIPPRDRWALTHVGELYNGRNASPILESIARLIATKRLPVRGVSVRLIGIAEAGTLPNQQFLDRARNEGWLELRMEKIPRNEALQINRSSDSLLLLQPQSRIQVPGKLFEYVQIGRPILAFIRPNSPSEWLLQQSGVPYRCVYPDSSPEAIDETIAEFFSIPSAPISASPWFEEHFNAEYQTQQLDAIIQSLYHDLARSTEDNPGQQLATEGRMIEPGREPRRRSQKLAADSVPLSGPESY